MYSRLFAFLYLPAGRFASIRVQKKSASVFYTLGGLYVITVPDYSTFRIADYGSRITDYGLMYLNPQSRNPQLLRASQAIPTIQTLITRATSDRDMTAHITSWCITLHILCCCIYHIHGGFNFFLPLRFCGLNRRI